MTNERTEIKHIIEAALLVADKPLTVKQLLQLFAEDMQHQEADILAALSKLDNDYLQRGIELKQVSSGYRIQARQEVAPWLAKLWEEKPPKYSRAVLETLVLIAYRQPITRSEIEDIRGVSVSSYIVKSLLERDWIRVVGHRDVPGKPALLATTKSFLDYFNLKNLEELPTLAEVRDLEAAAGRFAEQLELNMIETTEEFETESELKSVDDVVAEFMSDAKEHDVETIDAPQSEAGES